jgi:hypothetical protein
MMAATDAISNSNSNSNSQKVNPGSMAEHTVQEHGNFHNALQSSADEA